jgi:DeoR/GlpR family transcriptional regulator of sugar metabolism/ABC-type sugar transport system substrate-binding protein
VTTFERRQQLIEILRKQPGLRVPELAALLNVSQGTIRNDLDALSEEGLVLRVHGGAAVNEDFQMHSPSFGARSKKNAAAKLTIARWAAELVEDGDSILLDASTTVYYLARFLQNRRKLRVVTNGIEVARALAKNPTNTVILLGGKINPDGYSLSGPIAEQQLHDLYIQTAFVSCSGFTPEIGLTEVHLDEAQLKTRAITAAQQVIALVDSGKFGKVDLTAFARTEQITHLYSDSSLDPAWIERLQNARLPFSLCSESSVSAINPGNHEKTHFRIGFANLSERSPFAVDVRKSIERAAHRAGNVDMVLADNQLNPQTALKVAEQFLAEKLDLIIEYQIDEQMGNRIMSLFQDAGIPVISVDIPMIGATYFGVDNYKSGYLAGTALGEWVRDRWTGAYDRVIVLEEPRAGAVPATRIRSQLEGFQSILGGLDSEKCLTLNSGNTCEVSERSMTAAFKHLPDLHRLAVICFNDDAAIGALEAARKLGRDQDIVIVGQGADRRVRQELANPGSRIIGSTAFSPEAYGEKLIPLALRLLNCEAVPPAVYMDHEFITAAPLAAA